MNKRETNIEEETTEISLEYLSLKTSTLQARNRSSDYHMMTAGSIERCQTLVLAAEMVNE